MIVAGALLYSRVAFCRLFPRGSFAHCQQMGTRSLNPFLREASDGTVCVSETAVSTPHVRHTAPVTHFMLPLSPSVLRAAREFLNAPRCANTGQS